MIFPGNYWHFTKKASESTSNYVDKHLESERIMTTRKTGGLL